MALVFRYMANAGPLMLSNGDAAQTPSARSCKRASSLELRLSGAFPRRRQPTRCSARRVCSSSPDAKGPCTHDDNSYGRSRQNVAV